MIAFLGTLMPIVTCPACSKKICVPDEIAGKKVSCPYCKHVLAVPFGDVEQPPASDPPIAKTGLDALPASPPRRPKEANPEFDLGPAGDVAPGSFDFDDADENPLRLEKGAADARDDEPPRARAPKKKRRWEAIAAGILFIQIGLFVAALAFVALKLFSPIFLHVPVEFRDLPLLDLLQMSLLMIESGASDALMLTFLLMGIASVFLGMGHIAASEAPDPIANRRANIAFGLAVASIVCWLGLFASLFYTRLIMVEIKSPEELLARLGTFLIMHRIVGILFFLAGGTALASELFFVRMLRHAADVFDARRLAGWSRALVIFLSVALAAWAVLGGFVVSCSVFTDLKAGEVLRSYLILLLDRYEIYRWAALILAVAGMGCYWYTLRLGKKLLWSTKAYLKQRELV
jgi:hypothetical protein